MKAAARVRAYLDAAKKNYPGVPGVNQIDDSRLLMADLEALLASRARYRKQARRLRASAEILSGALAKVRAERNKLQAEVLTRGAAVAQLQTDLVRERRAAVESAREQTEEISLKFHDYRQDVDTYQKKLCNALYLPPLTSAEQILQEVQRVRQLSVTQQAEAEKAFLRAKDAERLRHEEHVELRKALHLTAATWEGMIKCVREQQEGSYSLASRAQKAEQQYRELRTALRQLVMDYLHPSFKDSTPDDQLAELRVLIRILQQPKDTVDASRSVSPDVVTVLQAALNQSTSRDQRVVLNREQAWQLLRRAKQEPAPDAKAGVAAISGARDYQLKAHPAPANSQTHRHMLQAALGLLTASADLYPFGDESWRGIYRRDGRRGQLAHAGACIAALIDMLPAPAQPGQVVKDRLEDLRARWDLL